MDKINNDADTAVPIAANMGGDFWMLCENVKELAR
jgi:hypothetical protein